MDEDVKKFLYNGSLTGRLMHAYHLLLSAKVPLEEAVICRDAVDFVAEEQRKRLAAFDTIGFLKDELAHERQRVARLERELKTARRKALEETAEHLKQLRLHHSDNELDCVSDDALAFAANEINALIEKEGK